MADKVKENKMMMEFGKWLMDVSKYVLTAVLISTFFKDINEISWLVTLSAIIVVGSLVAGMIIIGRNSNINNKKKK